MKPTLFLLAAGMGSRYGGLKQLDGLGPNGETIMDYSIYDAIKAGASGYLNKESAPSELVNAVRAVKQGRKYVSPALAQILATDLRAGHDERPLHATLSEREFQIFCKLAAGISVSQIGKSLNLSVKTISTYRSRVLEKMRMKNNADLTNYAIRNRLIE